MSSTVAQQHPGVETALPGLNSSGRQGGASIAQLINRFRTERPADRTKLDSGSIRDDEKRQLPPPVSERDRIPQQVPAVYPPAAEALTAVHAHLAAELVPAAEPTRVEALLRLAESCPPLLEVLKSMRLTPTGVREEQSISAVQQAIHDSDSILSHSPRIAAVGTDTDHEGAQNLQPRTREQQNSISTSPDSHQRQSRPNSPTQRFQNLSVHLASARRLPQRLQHSMKSVSSSPDSRSPRRLGSVPKAPYHHTLELGETASGQPPQRNNDHQPYHTLGREYPPSSSAGSFWSPGSTRTPSPAIHLRNAQSRPAHTAVTPHGVAPVEEALDDGSCSSSPQEPPSTTMSAASVSAKQLVLGHMTMPLEVGTDGNDTHQPSHTPASQFQGYDTPLGCKVEGDLHQQLSTTDDATGRSECGSGFPSEGPPEQLPETVAMPGSQLPVSGGSASVREGPSNDAECRHASATTLQSEAQDLQNAVSMENPISANSTDRLQAPASPAVCILPHKAGCSQASSASHSQHSTVSPEPPAVCRSSTDVVVNPAAEHCIVAAPTDFDDSWMAGTQEETTSPARHSPDSISASEAQVCDCFSPQGLEQSGDCGNCEPFNATPDAAESVSETAYTSEADDGTIDGQSACADSESAPLKATETVCRDAQHRIGSRAVQGASAVPVSLREGPESSPTLPTPRSCEVAPAEQHVSNSASGFFVNPIVKDIQQQARGISTRKRASVERQQCRRTGAKGNTVQSAISRDVDGNRREYDAQTAREHLGQNRYDTEVSQLEVGSDSLKHDDTQPHGCESRLQEARHRGRFVGQPDRSIVLCALPDNGQHTMSEQCRQIQHSSCDDSSPEFPASPKCRYQQPPATQNLYRENNHELGAVSDAAQACAKSATQEGVVQPCSTSNTVDAVRSIYWQLESFMEQYVATQCHDPQSRQASQQISDQECVQSPPTVTLRERDCMQGKHHVGGWNGQRLHSNVVHLSITSGPAHQTKHPAEPDAGPDRMAAHDKALHHEGLQAVVQLSGRNAEISIFDGNKDSRLSTVLVNGALEKPDSGQVSPVLSQEVDSTDCMDQPQSTRESDNSSEGSMKGSETNARLRFRQDSRKVVRGPSPCVAKVPLDDAAPESDHSSHALGLPFAVPVHIPIHAPWLQPFTTK